MAVHTFPFHSAALVPTQQKRRRRSFFGSATAFALSQHFSSRPAAAKYFYVYKSKETKKKQ